MKDRLLLSLYDFAEHDNTLLPYIHILEVDIADGISWVELGKRLATKKQYILARQCYDKAIEIKPDLIDAWLSKGNALNYSNQYDEAIKCYDKAIEIDPNNADALNAKGLALVNMGKFGEAIKCYDKAIEIDPNNADALNAKGLALDNLGKYDEAIGYYDKATELYANSVDELNKKGASLIKLRKFDEATKCYDEAIKIDPNNGLAWLSKGNALNYSNQYDEAIKCYDKAIEIDPNNADALNAKGLALVNMGKFGEAIKCYDKAIEIKPDLIDASFNKGRVLLSIGNYPEAKRYFNQTHSNIPSLDPRNVFALQGLHLIYSNYTYEFDQALLTAHKLLKIESSWENNAKLAEDLVKIGRYEEGRKVARQSLDETPAVQIKRQSILRFLVLASYLLKGDSNNGNKELLQFLEYYKNLEDDFRIEETVWVFNGMINAIDNAKINLHTKEALKDIVNLLQGKGEQK